MTRLEKRKAAAAKHLAWMRRARATRRAMKLEGGAFALAAGQQPDSVLLDPMCQQYLFSIHVQEHLFGPSSGMSSTIAQLIRSAELYGV